MAQLDLQKVHFAMDKVTYRGVKFMKFPFDSVQYQMIINEIRPDLIIEIGTLMGGSALYYADLMDTLGIDGEVHTIDIYPVRYNLTGNITIAPDSTIDEVVTAKLKGDNIIPDLVLNHPRIKFFTDGYEGYDLANCAGKERILVLDDGNHVYEHVLAALKKFTPVVTKGSYYIVEDGNMGMIFSPRKIEEAFQGGPVKAITEFLETTDDLKIDFSRCDMFGNNSTYNTYGYLKKVK